MIPVIDMRSGTGELSAATQGTLPAAGNLSRRARIRLAGNAVVARQANPMRARALTQLNSTTRKDTIVRHATPRNSTPNQQLNRAGRLVFAGIAYTLAGLATGLVTLGAALTIWGLWQWLGVN